MAVIPGTDKGETLTGGAGDDTLNGLGGDDILIGGPGGDTLDGGEGNDTASYITATEGVEACLTFDPFTTGDAYHDVYIGIENLTGSLFEDSLKGDAGVNILRGLKGNDTLIGLGNDVLYGGAGNDLYYVTGGDVVSEQTMAGVDDGGTDMVIAFNAAYALPDFVENLSLKADLAAISGTGNAEDNVIGGNAIAVLTLDGRAGNDTLNGGVMDDVLIGGAGADVLNGDDGNDTASYATAATGLTASLAAPGLNTGDATGDVYNSIENLMGSGFNDILAGHSGVNGLNGGAGDDILSGGAGADILNGGDGTDTAEYSLSAAGVTASLTSAGSNTGDAAGDSYFSIENLSGSTFNDVLVGNTGNNVLTGGAGDDILDGKEGADRMVGGSGNDTYSVENAGDVVVELAGEGTADTVKTNLSNYTLAANIENLILTGSGNVNGTGNELNNVITGNGLDNTLLGGKGDDILNGGNGNDILNGGTGFDRMNGGAGNDTYYYGSGDSIIEPENGGTDLVMSTVPTMTLGYTLENVTLVDASTAVNANGNNLDNVMIGNSAANILQGGGGNDTIDGGAGNDTINGGKGADILTGGLGNDIFVFASLNDSLANGVTTTTSYDRITDLGAGDVIDLHLIDADVHHGKDQAFHQVSAFTGHEAEMTLIYDAGTNTTTLSVDANGDKKADFIILITGQHTDPTGWLL